MGLNIYKNNTNGAYKIYFCKNTKYFYILLFLVLLETSSRVRFLCVLNRKKTKILMNHYIACNNKIIKTIIPSMTICNNCSIREHALNNCFFKSFLSFFYINKLSYLRLLYCIFRIQYSLTI
ncbi:hypothetical protein TUBRATIS_26970 [Tubulinosema ratisbonensis]|uniref:Uncharacterized protein n=1 Tax=Tubulinosema ratisbonensis TaxID=291195 RepID=A0A437AI95_9MICR|nr:hypothetical protein TUBRATIS_26970 [Tubulinosema ratisbonensis]